MALGVGGKRIGSAYVELEVRDRNFKRDLHENERQVHKTGSALKTGLAVGAAAAAGGLYLASKGLKAVIRDAKDAEASQAKVKTMLRNVGVSWKEHGAQIDRVIQKHAMLTGFDDEQLAESFANMLRATKNVNEALHLNTLVADIARSKGMGLAGAQSLVARVYNGAYLGLKKLGIAYHPVTTAQDKLRDSSAKYTREQMKAAKATDDVTNRQRAIALLQKNFGGQAEAYGKTSAGATDRFAVATENLREAIGLKLLPLLAPLLNKLSNLVVRMTTSHELAHRLSQAAHLLGAAFHFVHDVFVTVVGVIQQLAGAAQTAYGWLQKHKTTATLLISAIGGLVAAFAAYKIAILINTALTKGAVVAMKLYELWVLRAEVAQMILNRTMRANPFVLIVSLIAGLVVALILAYKRSETFRDIVQGVWKAVQKAVLTAVDLILRYIGFWLKMLHAVLEAGSHIPFIGDKFKQAAKGVQAAQEKVDGLRDSIKRTQGKKVKVEAEVNVRLRGAGPNDGRVGYDTVEGAVGDGIRGQVAANPWAFMPMASATGSAAGLKPMILDDLANARRYGLGLTSGYRPGAITSSGNVSLHSVGQAIDVAGDPSAMAMYAQSEAGRPGIAEVIYSPVGWWHPGSGWGPVTDATIKRNHYSHVHVGARSGDGRVGYSGLAIGDGKKGKKPSKAQLRRAAKGAKIEKRAEARKEKKQRRIDLTERRQGRKQRGRDRSEEDLTTPEGRAKRIAEIRGQIGDKKRLIGLKVGQAAALRTAAAKARRLGQNGVAARLTREAQDIEQDAADLREDVKDLQAEIAKIAGDTGDAAGPTADLPAEIQEAIFDAEGTAGLGDDIAAYQSARTFLQGELAKATTAAERLPIKQALRDVESKLQELAYNASGGQNLTPEQLAAQTEAFGGAMRGLDQYQSNIVLGGGGGGGGGEVRGMGGAGPMPGRPGGRSLADKLGEVVSQAGAARRSGAALGGAAKQITVHNHFNKPPDDPHPIMRSTKFAAEAVMG